MMEAEDDGAEPEFDETGFNQAMEEYSAELERNKSATLQGEVLKGIHFSNSECSVIFFVARPPQSDGNQPKVTAKEVQSALKAGTATPDLLKAEIARLNDREKRAKEIDQEKVQNNVHRAFLNLLDVAEDEPSLTEADLIAARLLVYKSLDYSALRRVNERLFSNRDEEEPLYHSLGKLTDQQFGFLIRAALAGRQESKVPNNATSYTLCKVAATAGLDVSAIEAVQEAMAKDRETRLNERLESLNEKIKG